MIRELEFNKTLGGTGINDVNEKAEILKDSISLITELTGILSLVSQELQSNGNDITLVLQSEQILSFDLYRLKEFNENLCGSTTALRRRMKTTLGLIDTIQGMVESAVEVFYPYSTEELLKLEELLKECIGNLSCFTYNQFGFSEFVLNEELPLEEIDVYDAVDVYMKRNKKTLQDISDLATSLNNLLRKCNPKIDAFERYPELLEPFSELVGASVYDLEDIDLITVKKVIDGDMSVDEFNAMLDERLLSEC